MVSYGSWCLLHNIGVAGRRRLRLSRIVPSRWPSPFPVMPAFGCHYAACFAVRATRSALHYHFLRPAARAPDVSLLACAMLPAFSAGDAWTLI
jgi:hypothetical protein